MPIQHLASWSPVSWLNQTKHPNFLSLCYQKKFQMFLIMYYNFLSRCICFSPVSSSIILCERRQLILQQNRGRASCINHQALLHLCLQCKPGFSVYPVEEILLSRGATIHVPEESRAEITFALKQVQEQRFWVILKDDSTLVFCTKAECKPSTANITTQKVVKLCQS